MSNTSHIYLDLRLFTARLSAHLDNLAGQVFEVEQAVGRMLSEEVAAPGKTISELQGLDYLRQTLEDTALLVHLLGQMKVFEGCKLRNVEKISEKLSLNVTQNLLATHELDFDPSQEKPSGELDLF